MRLRGGVAFPEDAGEKAVQFRNPCEEGIVSGEPFVSLVGFFFLGFNACGIDIQSQGGELFVRQKFANESGGYFSQIV